jgi:hypothetical protein
MTELRIFLTHNRLQGTSVFSRSFKNKQVFFMLCLSVGIGWNVSEWDVANGEGQI